MFGWLCHCLVPICNDTCQWSVLQKARKKLGKNFPKFFLKSLKKLRKNLVKLQAVTNKYFVSIGYTKKLRRRKNLRESVLNHNGRERSRL